MPIDDENDGRWNPHDPTDGDAEGDDGGISADRASDTSSVPQHCPDCGATRIERRHLARRILGSVGCAAGAAGAASRTWASVELGIAVGTGTAGPPGAVIGAAVGAIAGTVLSALGGAAAGCSLGVRLGDVADTHLLKDLRCLACGYCFSRTTGKSGPVQPSE